MSQGRKPLKLALYVVASRRRRRADVRPRVALVAWSRLIERRRVRAAQTTADIDLIRVVEGKALTVAAGTADEGPTRSVMLGAEGSWSSERAFLLRGWL
jgi:hypothetical protein